MIHTFSQKLKTRLQKPLPGLEAQMLMCPPIRPKDIHIPDNVRKSAVLILVYPHEGQWMIPFMRRTQDGRVPGGQICFPGGRHDKTDPNFTFTALREADEEMGIKSHQLEVVGNLTEVYIPPSNSLVYPRVAVAEKRPDFIPEPLEVAEIIEVPASEFLEEENRGIHRVDVFGGNFIEAPGYTVNGKELIWGGTAMMIAEFAEIVGEVIGG